MRKIWVMREALYILELMRKQNDVEEDKILFFEFQ